MEIDYKTLNKLKKQNKSDTEIGKMFNMTKRMICHYRKKLGVSLTCKTPGNRVYTINKTFFSAIDTQEKAYILGILSADGYVDKAQKTVSLALQKRDTHILKEIQQCLSSNAPVHVKHPGEKSWAKSDMAIIHLCSKKIISDLKPLGIVPNKTKNLIYPNIPNRLDRHYIRGLIDGDGNISQRQFSLVGTTDMLNGVIKAIFKHTGHLINHCPCNNHSRIVGYKKNKKVLSWIYKNSSIHLFRKYNLFQKYWSDIPCARVAS